MRVMQHLARKHHELKTRYLDDHGWVINLQMVFAGDRGRITFPNPPSRVRLPYRPDCSTCPSL